MMTALRRICLFASLIQWAFALDMRVDTNTMICDNRPIKASLSYLCGEDHLCQFGQQEKIKGTLTYDGLVDIYNASNWEYMYVDASMSLGLGGVKAFEQKLVKMARVPICSAFSANQYNAYGDCPADGRYVVETSYRFKAPESSFMEWASSGYDGDIVLDFYFRNDLVGRCVVETKTFISGSYYKQVSAPSGKVAAIVVLTLIAIMIAYIVFLIIKVCCIKRKTQQKRLYQAPSEDDEALHYSRMELQEGQLLAPIPIEDTRDHSIGPVI